MAILEVIPPDILSLPAYSDLWQAESYATINPSTQKVFALTGKVVDATYAQLYGKVTHMQWNEILVANVPSSQIWRNIRYYPGNTVQNVIDATPNDLKYLAFAQVMEDGQTAAFAEQVYLGLYNRLVSTYGITSPNQTLLAGDYFGPSFAGSNIDVTVPPRGSGYNTAWSNIRNGFTNQANARQRYNSMDGSWSFIGETGYTSQGWNNHRNWFTEGYLHNYWFTRDGSRTYNLIINLERMALAVPDRKRFVYGWTLFDNVGSTLYAAMSYSRIKFTSPSGDVMPMYLPPVPNSMMESEAFWARLVGDGYVQWDNYGNTRSDIAYWSLGWFGESTTFWQPTSGSTVQWAGTPPQINTGSPYANPPLTHGEAIASTGAAKGSYKFDLIEDASKELYYATFSYKVNGGSTQTGYYNGNTPELGSLGNGSVSRMNNANYGQTNSARSCENKKPLLVYGINPDNGKKFLAWDMPFVDSPDDVFEVTFTNGGGGVLNITGEGLRVFQIT